MKSSEIQTDEQYLIDPATLQRAPWEDHRNRPSMVAVTVIETGVRRPGYDRADAVRVRLSDEAVALMSDWTREDENVREQIVQSRHILISVRQHEQRAEAARMVAEDKKRRETQAAKDIGALADDEVLGNLIVTMSYSDPERANSDLISSLDALIERATKVRDTLAESFEDVEGQTWPLPVEVDGYRFMESPTHEIRALRHNMERVSERITDHAAVSSRYNLLITAGVDFTKVHEIRSAAR